MPGRHTRPRARGATALRAGAVAVVAVGVAAPLVRRRLRLPPPVTLVAAASAPVAICVALPRTRARDAALCALQMWAYVAAYEMPNDEPERLERRVRIRYPILVDRAIGAGIPPGLRLQRRFARPGSFRWWEKGLVWCHWLWFFVPHGTVAYVLVAHRERFARSATLTYAVFDLGCLVYWALPTAPPWYAAAHGHLQDGRAPSIKRRMIEYGESFWRERWPGLYDALGGNPLAAMPSLHFATSVMAAHLLAEVGPLHGAAGWLYAVALGCALVYLGEHYVCDLLAGLLLTESVRAAAPAAAPALRDFSRRIQALEARALA